MSSTAEELEDAVRKITALRWACPAQPEHIQGVNFDCVARPSMDQIILIEVTEERDLDKVRRDLTKIVPVRLALISNGYNCRAYIVMRHAPTHGMIEAGEAQKVYVRSLSAFESEFFDYQNYIQLRRSRTFGSSVDQKTGENDNISYIPVEYLGSNEISFDIASIATELLSDGNVLLVGDFGTGKSRCFEEVFNSIANKTSHLGKYALAINLRDHWGASTAEEVLSGHLAGIGFTASFDNVIRLFNHGNLVLLLDGFDEVGAQSFGANRDRRQTLRKDALKGVRELVKRAKTGVFITGREHYFDNDEEMLAAIGMSPLNTKIISCLSEFTVDQAKTYLHQLCFVGDIPQWLPKKPLIFQVLSSIDRDALVSLVGDQLGEFAFWGKFLNAISYRESNIHGSINQDAVRRVLLEIANATRNGATFLGDLTSDDLSSAYTRAAGESPDDVGQQMLMRLCTLGRVGSESPNRQFVDDYIADGLRAESFIKKIEEQDRSIVDLDWRQPLRRLGCFLISQAAFVTTQSVKPYQAMLHALAGRRNCQAYCEVLGALSMDDRGAMSIDMNNATVTNATFYWLGLKGNISNGYIRSCVIENLFLDDVRLITSSAFEIRDSIILDVYGISTASALPSFIAQCEINRYEDLQSASSIKRMNLSNNQKLLLAVVHKIFFQPGSARKEAALAKGGFGAPGDVKMISKILNVLLKHGVIEVHKGDEGKLYRPVRHYTHRMQDLKSQLYLSSDPIWLEVANL